MTIGSSVIGRSSHGAQAAGSGSTPLRVLYSVNFGVSLVLFLLNFFADDPPEYTDLSGEK